MSPSFFFSFFLFVGFLPCLRFDSSLGLVSPTLGTLDNLEWGGPGSCAVTYRPPSSLYRDHLRWEIGCLRGLGRRPLQNPPRNGILPSFPAQHRPIYASVPTFTLRGLALEMHPQFHRYGCRREPILRPAGIGKVGT